MGKEGNDKGGDDMATLTLEKNQKVLTPEKKQGFRQIVGKYSTRIDLNKVREEWKNDKK